MSNTPTLAVTTGLASATHPVGMTAIGAILAGVGVLADHPPHSLFSWVLAIAGAVSAAYGVIAPKVIAS